MKLLLLLSTVTAISCQTDISLLIEKVNDVTTSFNAIAADIAWQSSVDPGNIELPSRAANYQKERIIWEENGCNRLAALESRQLLNATERRITYLMCRGPRLTFDEARKSSALYQKLQSIYEYAEVCIPYDKPQTGLTDVEAAIFDYISTVNRVLKVEQNATVLTAAKLATKETGMESPICLKGESEFDEMMKFSRNEEVLRWLWLAWRDIVGRPMREPYKKMVKVENRAARRNGYKDVGASWRDELETPDLRALCRRLYYEIKPLYSLLHGVVRFFLRKEYGEDVVPELGPIPAHLLGNLWAQNWDSIVDLILPQTIDLDKSFKTSNWTAMKLVKHAEDFYQSLGLPAMTATFWRESVFARETPDTRCHGTAADMFKDGDFRLLYCSGTSAEDLYVLHHEMGHIQYYMAYDKQPGIFRQANSALHETVGDAIMYGVMTPQHLHRLGLINDSVLFTYPTAEELDEIINNNKEKSTNKDASNEESREFKEDGAKQREEAINKIVTSDDILILKQALNKLPQIPFALAIDEYRWKFFEGGLGRDINKEFWDLTLELQGVAPPEYRTEEDFDAGAKYHVPDNTPFIRYFLSSFLQHQLFESLCKASVFGRLGVREDLPETITMTRCDIYGSRSAGKLLKDFMSRGHSQHWQQILKETIGEDNISSSALKRYYRPLYKLLARLVRAHRIPIGW